MKVSTEHFAMIKAMFKAAFDINGLSKADWETLYNENTEQRKVWDLYSLSIKSSVMARSVWNPAITHADYYDSHLETAFKKAYSELS